MTTDWISPLVFAGYELFGNCVPVSGTAQEMAALEHAGIPCRGAMSVEHVGGQPGEWIWQIPRQYVRRAEQLMKVGRV